VQLFHTDEHYQPAWINGGILENKMIDNHSIAAFESWMIAPENGTFLPNMYTVTLLTDLILMSH
jgi:hypothetical protein